MQKSEQINELVTALAKAQATIKPPTRTQEARVALKSGGQYSYKYTSLEEVIEAARKSLSENGLAVMQLSSESPDACTVETVLAHSSGQWVSMIMKMKPEGSTPQSFGSCLTYCRRYSLQMILNLSAEDDDGKAASEESEKKPDVKEKPKTSPEALGEAARKHEFVTQLKRLGLTPTEAEVKKWLKEHKIEMTWKELKAEIQNNLIEQAKAEADKRANPEQPKME